jgi:L-tyrosine peroxygenase
MRQPIAPAALRPPSGRDWDFGDYPYGLEPVLLPAPDDRMPAAGEPARRELRESFRALADAAAAGFTPTEPAVGDALTERLFWFRWIAGHHVSFIIWRLLSDALRQVHDGTGDQAALARAIIAYVRAYSGMMIYTGSPNRPIYHNVIRPSMHRQHTTFSGTWAPDYPAVRSLFRGRKLPPVIPAQAAELNREIQLANRIHVGVASKLVVGGRSLLQESINERGGPQPRMWGAIFDCYFVTVRGPVTAQQVTAQLLRRLKAIAIDIATNGLYPLPPDDAQVPDELRGPDVAECERDLVGQLLRMGGLAVGATADPAPTPSRTG